VSLSLIQHSTLTIPIEYPSEVSGAVSC